MRSSNLGFNEVVRSLWLTGLGVVVLVVVLVLSMRGASRRSGQALKEQDPSKSGHPGQDDGGPRGGNA